MYICIYMYIDDVYVYMYLHVHRCACKYIYTYTIPLRFLRRQDGKVAYAYVYECNVLCIHMCMNVYIYKCAYTHVY